MIDWMLSNPVNTAVYVTTVVVLITAVTTLYTAHANHQARSRAESGIRYKDIDDAGHWILRWFKQHSSEVGDPSVEESKIHSVFLEAHPTESNTSLLTCKRAIESLEAMQCIHRYTPTLHNSGRKNSTLQPRGWKAIEYKKWQDSRRWWHLRLKQPPF